MICFDVFSFGFAAVFTGLHLALSAGLFREWLFDRKSKRTVRPYEPSAGLKVSVIVPLRNEERRIGGLLESLALQDYPEAEYIFVDDCSTDSGPEMLRRFAGTRERVRIITLDVNPGINRKQYALLKGMEAARGGLLLFTDADCRVPPSWIGAMAARISGKTGLVIGPVFKKEGGAGFFRHYQSFDHAIRYLYLAGTVGLGAAGGGFGNNLIVSREALESIGGYAQVPPSLTEDAALVSMIRERGEYGVRAALGRDVWVRTRGEDAWKPMINQTLRWNNGGLFSPDLMTRVNFSVLMVSIALGMLALPILPFVPSLWPLPAAVLLSMTLNTIACLGLFGAALPGPAALALVQIVFTPAYFTFLTFLGFLGVKADWKGAQVEARPWIKRSAD
ncbi:MAG: glycosyltransferase [Treponema sp.]|nr:glycosyltransferase [Treponema sp.]